MIELPLHIHKKKFDLDQYICDSFSDPIIFYLGHKKDPRNFFITFVLVNFKDKEYTYITSYSPENVKIIEASPNEQLLRNPHRYHPHCTIVINPEEDFYTFIENGQYFCYINMKKKILRVITGADLPCEGNDSIIQFGSTFYKDDADDKFFYFTARIKKNPDNDLKSNIYFYRSDLGLQHIKKIHETKGRFMTPHVTRKYKNTLLNSRFYFNHFELLQSGQKIVGNIPLYRYLYRSMYNDFCKMLGRESTDRDFRKAVTIRGEKPILSFFFSLYMKYKYGGKNLKQICDSVPELQFKALSGYITLVDLPSGTETEYQTTTANPAHFEIDEVTDDVYVSSHNFTFLDRLYYMGPAAIDKYHFHNGSLTKKGTFQVPDGFRFTTHKFFRYKGNSYLCTFSQPNKLMLIDADRMSLIHSETIGTDYMSQNENPLDIINYKQLESVTIKTIEISDDGEILLFIGFDGIYFYDFPNRRIITRIPYLDDTVLFDEVNLNQFYKRTTHIQYFK